MDADNTDPLPSDVEVDVERQARALRRLARAFWSSDSYGLVLLMIIATYVVSVTATKDWTISIVLFMQIATVWLALRTSQALRSLRFVASALFALAALTAVANLFVDAETGIAPWSFIAAGVLYLVAPFAIIRHIAYRRGVDQETMLGALSAYLFMGMAFAFTYRFLGAVQDSVFFGAQGDGTLSQDLFFSFTTLTTTGYGNLVPAGNPGQTFAVLEMLLGQLFLITAVGKIVTVWRPRGWRAPGAGPQVDDPQAGGPEATA